MQSFSFTARGRKYIVTTEAIGTAFSMSGYWLYEPSVILPCDLTGGKYVFLINRNRNSTHGQEQGEIITARTSDDPYNFGSETTILDNNDVDNICDMICARPIWDGTQWHIYVQALAGNNSNLPTSCPGPASIYEAVGASLDPPASFEWVKVPGTDHAAPVISGTVSGSSDKGIGELMQWYNPSLYGLPSYPFMVTFNNWGCDSVSLCDQAVFNYLSSDGASFDYWYGPEATPYPDTGVINPADWGYGLVYSDGILLGDFDAGRLGNPGIGFTSQCYAPDGYYQYCLGIGFFSNPSNAPYTAPKTGYFALGALDSVDSDAHGPRMSSPRLARNEYGYLPPKSYHGYPRTWETYLYYNPSQQRRSSSYAACSVTSWGTSQSQSISVSRLTITEQSNGRSSS